MNYRNFLKKYFPVIKFLILIVVSIFFIVLGVQILIYAFNLKEPFSFIMTFFASNLMILISFALLIGFVVRLISYNKKLSNN